MVYIKSNFDEQIKQKMMQSRRRHSQEQIRRFIQKVILNFLSSELDQKSLVSDMNDPKLLATIDIFINHLVGIAGNQNTIYRLNITKPNLLASATANDNILMSEKVKNSKKPRSKKKVDLRIPAEKKQKVEIPEFYTKSLRKKDGGLILKDSKKRSNQGPEDFPMTEARMMPVFKTKNHLNKLKMLKTIEEEEDKKPSEKRDLIQDTSSFEDNDIEDLDASLMVVDYRFSVPDPGNSNFSSNYSEDENSIDMKIEGGLDRQKKDYIDGEYNAMETEGIGLNKETTQGNEGMAGINFDGLKMISDAFKVVNSLDEIEEMLENYFDVNIDEFRQAFFQKKRKNIESINGITHQNDQINFSNCLLDYLESKEMREMDAIEEIIGSKGEYFESIKAPVEKENGFLQDCNDSMDSQDYPIQNCIVLSREIRENSMTKTDHFISDGKKIELQMKFAEVSIINPGKTEPPRDEIQKNG